MQKQIGYPVPSVPAWAPYRAVPETRRRPTCLFDCDRGAAN